MTPRSAFDHTFLEQVQHWIEDSNEVFVVLRYAYAAGAKDYLFVRSFAQFTALLATLPPRTDVIVFQERQLSIRGIADDSLLNEALTNIPEGIWWFLLCREGDNPGDYSSAGDDTHAALREAFQEYQGKYITLGLDPPWNEADNATMQSGLIPMPDGRVVGGAY